MAGVVEEGAGEQTEGGEQVMARKQAVKKAKPFKLMARSEESKAAYFEGFHAALRIAAALANKSNGGAEAESRIRTRLELSEQTLAHFKAVTK